MTNEASPPEKPTAHIITESLIAEAMKSFGAPIHAHCPRCESDQWNASATSGDRVVLKYDPTDPSHVIHPSLAFYIDCGNCGFLEHYKWAPVIEYVINKDG